MSQKRAFILLLIIATFVGAFFAWSFSIQNKKERIKNELLALKVSRFVDVDSTALLLPESNFVMLIYFDSECVHCRNETLEVSKNLPLFSNTKILLISSEPIKTIKAFAQRYGLRNEPSVTFAKINSDDVFDTFGSISLPHIFIYGKDRKLIKEFRGETKIEAILKYLK
jgi:thioredoxin-related protein